MNPFDKYKMPPRGKRNSRKITVLMESDTYIRLKAMSDTLKQHGYMPNTANITCIVHYAVNYFMDAMEPCMQQIKEKK